MSQNKVEQGFSSSSSRSVYLMSCLLPIISGGYIMLITFQCDLSKTFTLEQSPV